MKIRLSQFQVASKFGGKVVDAAGLLNKFLKRFHLCCEFAAQEGLEYRRGKQNGLRCRHRLYVRIGARSANYLAVADVSLIRHTRLSG